MSSTKVPDAWDDDWIQGANKLKEESKPAALTKKQSKAEKRAQQAEFNRQLWAEANDTRDPFLFPQQSEVPLQSGYTPAVKVLSRKPTTQGPNTISGLAQLGLDDGEEDDEEVKRQKPLTAEERQYKAQKDREEKQRKYDETRRRLGLGTTNESPSPGNVSPRSNQGSRHQSKTRNGDVRPSSAVGTKPRQLYDPNYQAKPDSISAQKQSSQEGIQRHVPAEEQPIRSPRGPDPTGKGFAPRAT